MEKRLLGLVEKYFNSCWGYDGNGMDTVDRAAKKIYDRIAEEYPAWTELDMFNIKTIEEMTDKTLKKFYGTPSYRDYDLFLFDMLCGFNDEAKEYYDMK